MSGYTGKGVSGHGIYEQGRLGLRHMTTPTLPKPSTVVDLGLTLALNTEPGEERVGRSSLLWGRLSGHGWMGRLCYWNQFQ